MKVTLLNEDEEDDTPIGSLIRKKKKPTTRAFISTPIVAVPIQIVHPTNTAREEAAKLSPPSQSIGSDPVLYRQEPNVSVSFSS